MAQLIFAKKYRDWTSENWKTVLISNEFKINQFASNGRYYVCQSRLIRDPQALAFTFLIVGVTLSIASISLLY